MCAVGTSYLTWVRRCQVWMTLQETLCEFCVCVCGGGPLFMPIEKEHEVCMSLFVRLLWVPHC